MSSIAPGIDGTAITTIYDEAYASVYERLYLDPWPAKHDTNLRILRALLPAARQSVVCWLDLCCGQAWHFQQFPQVGQRIGLDLSPSQLVLARQRNPGARFVADDVLDAPLPDEMADLVTCFWGAYCYLDDEARIDTFLRNALRWTTTGGALYLELLLPDALSSFNACTFARQTAFRVQPLSPDFHHWAYSDVGGTHRMNSPSLQWFMRRLAPAFEQVQVHDDGGFMRHLVAVGKRACRRSDSPAVRA
jgi:ubiquinone/menaquinone biosynthesis C-methylase UbiE